MVAGDPVYLDYNATAPVRPAALRAVTGALAVTGNPSSVHGFGRGARRLVEDARERIAAWAGAASAAVVFTSGGTEANALALRGWGRRRIVASAVEHPSVLAAGVDAMIPVDDRGIIDLAALDRLLTEDSEPAVVAVMLANNETGVIQPVAEAARVAKARGAVVHCDAVQAAGRLPLSMAALGVHSLAVSGHKLGGPQGTGALLLADAEAEVKPLLAGGGQEKRRRAGTENVPGIAGFAAAVAELEDPDGERIRLAGLRDRLEAAARDLLPTVVIFGRDAPRLSNTTCLAVPGVAAQTMVMALDLAGVAVSAGSACSSGKVAPSHVLSAMGQGALAGSAIRVSLGWASSERDVDRFIEAFGSLMRRSAIREGAASAA